MPPTRRTATPIKTFGLKTAEKLKSFPLILWILTESNSIELEKARPRREIATNAGRNYLKANFGFNPSWNNCSSQRASLLAEFNCRKGGALSECSHHQILADFSLHRLIAVGKRKSWRNSAGKKQIREKARRDREHRNLLLMFSFCTGFYSALI